jgi:hypothetical protein
MIMEKHSNLGPPSLELGGLRLWLRGRHFPWEEDFWNEDWHVVTAHWHSACVDVRAHGPFLHTGDLPRWLEACERLLADRSGMAMLWAVKPELQISLSAASGGPRAEVRLSPDLASQEHIFRFQINWEALELFTRSLKRHAESDPIRKKGLRKPKASRVCHLEG